MKRLCCSLLLAIVVGAQNPTPEHTRYIDFVNRVEKAPLAQHSDPEFPWAMQWFKDTQDVTLYFCGDEIGRLMKEKGRNDPAFLGVFFGLASGRFELLHPDQAKNGQAVNADAAEATLRAYDAILAAQPKAHLKTLDRWKDLQKQGKLADAVGKGCPLA
jgi:hypothetical protein